MFECQLVYENCVYIALRTFHLSVHIRDQGFQSALCTYTTRMKALYVHSNAQSVSTCDPEMQHAVWCVGSSVFSAPPPLIYTAACVGYSCKAYYTLVAFSYIIYQRRDSSHPSLIFFSQRARPAELVCAKRSRTQPYRKAKPLSSLRCPNVINGFGY